MFDMKVFRGDGEEWGFAGKLIFKAGPIEGRHDAIFLFSKENKLSIYNWTTTEDSY